MDDNSPEFNSVEQAIPKRIEDPAKLIAEFRSSDNYRESFAKFFHNKSLAEDVTEEEKRQVFEKHEAAKYVLLDYSQNNRISFHYNPSFYSKGAQHAIQDYIDQVRDMTKMIGKGVSQEDLIGLDKQRSIYHNSAARILADQGIVPSDKIGRTFLRLILIGEKLDTYDTARIPDLERIRRTI